MKKILLVSGFVTDTFTEIEKSLIDLTLYTNSTGKKEIIWLVPNKENKYNSYKNKEVYDSLKEPIYVTKLKENNIKILEYNVSKYNIIKNYFNLKRIIKDNKIESIYTHFGYERFHVALAGKLSGAKVIWNEHWFSLNTKFTKVKKLFYKNFVDEFICVSKCIYDSIDTNNKHLIYNAVNIKESNKINIEQREQLCKKLNLDPNKKNVIMVAAYRKEKRHDLAVEVIKNINKVRNDIQFIMLGEGPHKEEFIKQINELNLDDSVKILGHVTNVDEYYKISDLSMLTSIDEPFGYVVIEAMLNNIPVIAFNSGGPSEIITNNKDGYLIEQCDVEDFSKKIIELFNNNELLDQFSINAREKVIDKFNREKWLKDIYNIL